MASSRTFEAEQQHEQSSIPVDGSVDSGFGAEFRELARQRRFVREADVEREARESEFWGGARDGSPTPPPATRRAIDRITAPPAQAAAPAAAAPPAPAPSTPTPAPAAVAPVAPTAARAVRAPRMSEDQRATLLELARMSDRLVQSREALAAATTRAEHLEAELGAARDGLSAANDRLMASRVLVQDAQRTTRELAERAAWLEGRVVMLQEALELAVNASFVTRWKWRREQRARARD